MMHLILFSIITLAFLGFFMYQWKKNEIQFRSQSLFPGKHQPTMFDVRNLIIKGEKDSAIKLYCQIFSVKHKEAAKAVEELGRSIQEKNFEV